MAGSLFNKFKEDWVKVLLVQELREMLQVQGEIMQLVKQGLLSVITVRLAFLADLRISDGQEINTTIPQNAAFQTNDLDAYDFDYDDISSANAVLMANLSSYDSNVLSEVVKVRTTPDAITEGSWGFKYTKKFFKEKVIPFINSLQASFKDFENGIHSELTELKTVFNQMEAAVDQCSVDKKLFDIQKKELSLDNDQILDHIICQDVMNIVMHVDYVLESVLHADNKCLVDANLESERLIQENDH
ncbi:hypothetical protein Tco_0751259 [Tanacetum coccineum]|uniref:Uncharacterized protein n=1 Tax=Tanacetum coccineum TaxID=301880 RepID=A0ABQ4Z3I7_9ASTR